MAHMTGRPRRLRLCGRACGCIFYRYHQAVITLWQKMTPSVTFVGRHTCVHTLEKSMSHMDFLHILYAHTHPCGLRNERCKAVPSFNETQGSVTCLRKRDNDRMTALIWGLWGPLITLNACVCIVFATVLWWEQRAPFIKGLCCITVRRGWHTRPLRTVLGEVCVMKWSDHIKCYGKSSRGDEGTCSDDASEDLVHHLCHYFFELSRFALFILLWCFLSAGLLLEVFFYD